MFRKIVIGCLTLFVMLVLGFLILVSLQPGSYLVQRSLIISAPLEKVFALVNDLQAWDAWTPWKEEDPDPKTVISNPSVGNGAKFSWDGNDKVGAGTLTILESKPNELVDIEQEFVRPMVGKCHMAFRFELEGQGTKLTWKMDGKNDYLAKAMCLFVNLEKIIGPKFEKGLAKIKELAEEPGNMGRKS